MTTNNFQRISNFLNKRQKIQPPAYPWQELALKVIKELNIPQSKKSAIFKVCRDFPKELILRSLTDTQELSKNDQKWKYFFKLTNQYKR